MNVDPDFKPVAQPPRRQPFRVREKMEKEIQHLLDQDIIKKVNKPTGWVSPPVDQSQIRLNIDMRVANQAIPRRHTQHPMIDDVITELSSLRTQTYFRRSLGFAENSVCEPEPRNDFCDVAILSQSQFSSSSPRTTARGIRASCERNFISNGGQSLPHLV